jgi:hypothetical protein
MKFVEFQENSKIFRKIKKIHEFIEFQENSENSENFKKNHENS